MTHRVFAGIASALALSASIAAASDYSDFRIPSHSTSRLNLGLYGRYSNSRTNLEASQAERSFGQGNASGSWASGYDSERFQYALLIAGGAQGSLTKEQESHAYPFPLGSSESDQKVQVMDELWSLQASAQGYPTTSPWAVGAGVSGDARYGQAWLSSVDDVSTPPTRTRTENHDEEWAYQYFADVFVFTGWGRVRDATGVQQVQFIEDRLIREGVLTGPLQQRTRQTLAELFYVQSGFQVVHDQPDRFFWSEFERILRTDPALRSEMFNSYAVIRAGDPVVVAGRLDRQIGAFVGPLLTLRHTNLIHRSDRTINSQFFSNDTLIVESNQFLSSRFEADDQIVLGGLQVTVERPLSTRWHLSVFALGQSDVRGPDWYAELQSGMSLRYWGGERWYADAQVNQFRVTGDDDTWGVAYGGSVNYYLEDHVSIGAAVVQSQSRGEQRFVDEIYNRSTSVTLGLAYRRGTLTAPGLVGKVRPVGS